MVVPPSTSPVDQGTSGRLQAVAEVLQARRTSRVLLDRVTIKDTVNEALRRAARQRSAELARALTVLADADLDERSAAWR